MESSSPDLIGIPLLAYKASNNEETALAIARKGYNDKDTLISDGEADARYDRKPRVLLKSYSFGCKYLTIYENIF